MKKVSVLLALLFGTILSVLAQSVPQGMNYQAVARDLSGQVLSDQDITLKLTLLSQTGKAAQVEAYSEIHFAKTNKLGLFTLVIGQGTVILGTFRDVPWSTSGIWMELAIDITGGGDFEVLNNTRLLTVPYAFHASTASELIGKDEVTSSEKAGAKKEWLTAGNDAINPAIHKLGTTDSAPLIVVTNNTERMRVTETGNVLITNELIVTGNVTANAFIGDGSALTNIDINDADPDPANELNTSTILNGTTLEITDAGGTKTTDLSSLEESAEVTAAQTSATAAQATADQATTDAASAQTSANAAQATANQATTDAAAAQTSANAAQATANQATTDAAAAQTSADAAQTTADQATTDAAAAQTSSDAAQTTADQATTDAAAAQTSANAAQATADQATTDAAAAQTSANAAQATADQATTDAAAAQTSANAAQATANQATTDAAAAQTSANAAQAAADQAATDAAAAQTDIDSHILTDVDLDATNELNTTFSLSGNTLSLTDDGGTLTADLSTIGQNGTHTLLQDLDNDTKIQVEESPDEDIIRFDLGGVEFGYIQTSIFSPRFHLNNVNTFYGKDAGLVSFGGENTAYGYSSLIVNNAGSQNTAIGGLSMRSNTTGTFNTALGYNTDVSTGSLSNATAIGANATVSASNSLVLGNNAKVGIGTSSPDEALHVEGNIKMIDGNQAAGKVLISDPAGVASWQNVHSEDIVYPVPEPDFSCMKTDGSLVIGDTPTSIAIAGNYAFVVDQQSHDLKVINVSDPKMPSLTGSLIIGNTPKSIAIAGNYAFVVDQQSDDLKVIDVSDPTMPSLTGSLAIGNFPASIAIAGNYAYVVETAGELKVIDISDPASPNQTGSLTIENGSNFIAVAGNYVYIPGFGGKFQVIDISDPSMPTLTSNLAILGLGAWSVAVAGNYACVVNAIVGDLKVIDISNPASPTQTGSLTIGNGAWPVSMIGNFAFVPSPDLKVIDISDPTNPVQTGSLGIGPSPSSVAVAGNYAYITDASNNDLKVIRLTCLVQNALSFGPDGSLSFIEVPIITSITDDGTNVGIGTSAPSHKFAVVASDSGYVASFVNTNDGNGDGIKIQLGKTHPRWNGTDSLGFDFPVLGFIDGSITATTTLVKGFITSGFTNLSFSDFTMVIDSLSAEAVDELENFLPLAEFAICEAKEFAKVIVNDVANAGNSAINSLDVLDVIDNSPIPTFSLSTCTVPEDAFTSGFGFSPISLSSVDNSLTTENQYLQFTDKDDRQLGAVRAESIENWCARYLSRSYFLNVFNSFAGVTDIGLDPTTWGGMAIKYGVNGITQFSNILDAYNSIGVEYSSGFGDYAEWLERVDLSETIKPGDIVGITGGKISKDLTNAEQVMAVSSKPIVLGNTPPKEKEYTGNKVAFMGQIPVKIMGPVRSGDFIVGKGEIPGYGVAIHPEDMNIEDFELAVGRSWETVETPGPKMVNTVVGVHNGNSMVILKKYQQQLEQAQKSIDLNNERLDALEAKLGMNFSQAQNNK